MMKKTCSLFLLLRAVSCWGQLFPIQEGGQWGGIDSTGGRRIAPRFEACQLFAEGLAGAKTAGQWGFIDMDGNWQIPPAFARVEPFCDGLACVWNVAGEPMFVDTEGKPLFAPSFREILPFGHREYTRVQGQGYTYGLINRAGVLLADTVFTDIGPFINGVAIVLGDAWPEGVQTGYKKYQYGLMDSTGVLLVPFGKFHNIYRGEDRRLYATVYEWNDRDQHFWDVDFAMDRRGQVTQLKSLSGEPLSRGEATPFAHGCRFERTNDDMWVLRDSMGKRISRERFSALCFPLYDPENQQYLFYGGVQPVKTKAGWGTVDTNGVFLPAPAAVNGWRLVDRVRNVVVIRDTAGYVGWWNLTTLVVVSPRFRAVQPQTLGAVRVAVQTDSTEAWVTDRGELIWESGACQVEMDPGLREAENMLVGEYYAVCSATPPYKQLGGYAKWGCAPGLLSGRREFTPGNVQLILSQSADTQLYDYPARRLSLANTTSDTVYIRASDSHAKLVLQAKNSAGQWQDIESFEIKGVGKCGNSDHSLFLEPGKAWSFASAVYGGIYCTSIRAKAMYKVKFGWQTPEYPVYSNEVLGWVSPAQFEETRYDYVRYWIKR